MADSDVSVRFGADTAGVTTGATAVKGELSGLQAAVQALANGFKALLGSAVAGFDGIKAGAAEATAGVKETAASLGEAKESAIGFGKALLAALAVKEIADFSGKLAETAESVAHAATAFGSTTGNVQELKAMAAGLDIPFSSLETAVLRSSRALTTAREGSKQASEAFKVLGIDIHSAVDPITLLNEEIAGLAAIPDQTTKIGIAFQIFGRNLLPLAPLLGLTKAQMAELNTEFETYGIKNDDAEAKGLALADSLNVNKVAMMGLGNTLTQALAPVLTQVVEMMNRLIAGFIASYNSGGVAKGMLDAIVISLKVLLSGLIIAGTGWVEFFAVAKAAIDSFGAIWQLVVDEVQGQIKVLGDRFVTLGKVIHDSLTNNVIQAANDMRAGWTQIQSDAAATADAVQKDFAAISKAALPGMNEAMGAQKSGMGMLGEMWGPDAKANLPKGSGGGAVPDLGGGKKGGKESQIGTWTEQLQQQELAAAASSQNYMKDELQAEIDFWNTKLSTTTEKSKLWYDVQAKLFPLLKQQQSDAYNSLISGDKEQISADRDNIAQWRADWDKYLGDVAKAYGKDSAQFKAALKEKEDAERAYIEQMRTLEAKRIQDAEKADQGQAKVAVEIAKISYSEQAALVDNAEKSGVISAARALQEKTALLKQEQAAERSSADQDYQTQLTALTKIQALYPRDSAKWGEIEAQKVQLTQQYGTQLQLMAVQQSQQWFNTWMQRLQQLQQQFHSYVNPIVSAWGSAMTQMAEGTMTFRQAVTQIGQSILQVFVGIAERMVENWIVNLLISKTQQGLTASAQVASNAAVAASAAIASTAAIPIVGPELAPAAGAAAFAEAISFEGLAGFSGGGILAADGPIFAHKDEAVLPAYIAKPLAQMAQSGGASGGPWGGGHHIEVGGPTVNVSGGSGSAGIAQAVVQALADHPTKVAGAVASALRGGWRPSYKQPTGAL